MSYKLKEKAKRKNSDSTYFINDEEEQRVYNKSSDKVKQHDKNNNQILYYTSIRNSKQFRKFKLKNSKQKLESSKSCEHNLTVSEQSSPMQQNIKRGLSFNMKIKKNGRRRRIVNQKKEQKQKKQQQQQPKTSIIYQKLDLLVVFFIFLSFIVYKVFSQNFYFQSSFFYPQSSIFQKNT